jgi:hypothetical protein
MMTQGEDILYTKMLYMYLFYMSVITSDLCIILILETSSDRKMGQETTRNF